MGICSRIKSKIKAKKPVAKSTRTYADKMILAKRIGAQAQIKKLLQSAQTIEEEVIALTKRIEHTKEGSIKRQALVNLILEKNSAKSNLSLQAKKLHESIQAK